MTMNTAPRTAARPVTTVEANIAVELTTPPLELPKLVEPSVSHCPPPLPFEVARTAWGTVAVFKAPVCTRCKYHCRNVV